MEERECARLRALNAIQTQLCDSGLGVSVTVVDAVETSLSGVSHLLTLHEVLLDRWAGGPGLGLRV